jgi:dihydroorotate dehydrogenase
MPLVGLYENVLRPALFQLDPEAAHELAMGFLRKGLLKANPFADPKLEQTLFGVRFPNPLGLAAGFDKNAVALDHWHLLGFGFVEAGTVTLQAQPGNPKPRMFRLPQDQALVNRLGFNNDGARTVATRLAEARPKIAVGINLGKNRDSAPGDAVRDYREAYRILHPFGNYFVVNVSSPNTPGLRDLQERGPLEEIVRALRAEDADKPLFVKVAPDLEPTALDEVVAVVHETGATGLIATNTTISREGLTAPTTEAGGLSGRPLRERSDEVLRHLYRSCDRHVVLMGVGGILDGDDLYRKISLGAHLCQVYTGWIYGGLQMVPTALARLSRRMETEGIESLEALRGKDA